jgi:hypothetical protein
LGRTVSMSCITLAHLGQRSAVSGGGESGSCPSACPLRLSTPNSCLAFFSASRLPGPNRPSYRTLTKWSGSPCCRNRRMNSAAGTVQTWMACLGISVLAGDLAIYECEDAVVADRHTKDVRHQIVQGFRSPADRLTMYHPVLFPEVVGDQVKQGGPAQRMAHVGTKQDGKRLDRHQEIFPGWEPLTAIGSKPACGHQLVHMGMIVHGTSPGVQDPRPSRSFRPQTGEPRRGLGGPELRRRRSAWSMPAAQCAHKKT